MLPCILKVIWLKTIVKWADYGIKGFPGWRNIAMSSVWYSSPFPVCRCSLQDLGIQWRWKMTHQVGETLWSPLSHSVAFVTEALSACQGHSCNSAGYCSPEPLSLSFIHCCYIFQDLSDSVCFSKAWQRCPIHFPWDISLSNCRMCCLASVGPEGWIWTFS